MLFRSKPQTPNPKPLAYPRHSFTYIIMNSVISYLSDYCRLCIDVNEKPKGLEHNTDFEDFVVKREQASILVGYDEKTNSFVVGSEGGHMDAWLLLSKQEGKLTDSDDISLKIDITIATSLDELKEQLAYQVMDAITVKESNADSIEYQLMEVIKSDLYASPAYFKKIREGEMSTVVSFEDERTVQNLIKDIHKSPEAERASNLLESIISYTDPSKELTSAQIDSSIKEVIECFQELIQPERATDKAYDSKRLVRLVEIYADRLYKEAHKENSQIDLFDYENCNMRLKLSMWKDILSRYMARVEEMATKHTFDVSMIFEGPYSDYIKKLNSANYLRGIYDELIRYCKYFNLKECDDQLQAFNQRRKDEKLAAKAERDAFFKEFTPYLMQIIEHVGSQLIPRFSSNPKATLEEIKKWNNVLNFRKNTAEVKKIREDIVSKMPQVFSQLTASLKSIAGKIDDPMSFVDGWREGSCDLEAIRSLVTGILEIPNEDINSKFDQHKKQFEDLIKKFCSKIETDTERMKSQDQRSFEQTTLRRLDISVEEEIYAFVSPSLKAEEFSYLLERMKQYKLDDYFSVQFRSKINEQIRMRETTTLLRQVLQAFMFNIERVDEGLLDIVKGDLSVTNLLKALKKKQDGDYLSFKDCQDAEDFLKEVNLY